MKMRNKKLYKVLASLIACLVLIVFINTGCFYSFGKKIGEQIKQQSLNNTSSSSVETENDKTSETETSKEILTPETSTSNIDNTDTSKDEQSQNTSKDEQSQNDNQNSVDKDKEGIQISLNTEYKFNISGNISVIDFAVIIPKEYKNRQKIINSDYSIEPKRIFEDGTCTYAEFEINEPPPNFEINIMDEMILYQYGLDNAFKSGNKDIDTKDLFNYTVAEKYIEKDDKSIIEIANSFEGEDTYALVEAIYNYVMDNMEWIAYVPEDVGAKVALTDKQGDCTSYSDLFIALLRARGIPARIVEGYTINAINLNEGHNWVEVYFDDIGWVPFDPTFDDNNGSTSLFNNLDNIYVYFSLKRNDLILSGFHYYAYNWYGDGKVDIVKNISVN
jgi:transglutaminase-like putative cysteine protease